MAKCMAPLCPKCRPGGGQVPLNGLFNQPSTPLEATRAWWMEATAYVPKRGPLPCKGYRLPPESGKLLSGLGCLAASLCACCAVGPNISPRTTRRERRTLLHGSESGDCANQTWRQASVKVAMSLPSSPDMKANACSDMSFRLWICP
ncbi:unnamed protein product [Merluccius merluccius]